MKRNISVLIIDDNENTLNLLRQVLGEKGFPVSTALSGEEGMAILRESGGKDIVFIDQRLPGINGLATYRQIKEEGFSPKVIMITAYAAITDAVAAMKLGAFEYLIKSFNNLDEIELGAERAAELIALERENALLRTQVRKKKKTGNIICGSEKMQRILDTVKKVAPLDSTVMITGESGAGKEMIAQAIHELSARKEGPFIAVNCAAIPEGLLESALFGFEKGAFTGAIKMTPGCFEEAGRGTLFLDEISSMSAKLQGSLLRVIQEREFCRLGSYKCMSADFRLITATNRELEGEVAQGRFREDLFYRLSVIPLKVPPLRERREDIPLLTGHFLERMNNRLGKNVGPAAREVMKLFLGYPWPGNCRELQNVIEYLVATKQGGEITPEDLPESLLGKSAGRDAGAVSEVSTHLGGFMMEKWNFEKKYFQRALAECDGNITKLAQVCGIARQNLYGKLKKYGLKWRENV
ncbi:MAG: sigma-54-dependent Fis family transcriptional regulator [Nitrospinae bacterium]|nr:sigma-54-dependent Fis family transcriptional regulator [Nitrospinota bacterium]